VVIGAIIAKGAGTMIAIVRTTVTETVVDADFEAYHGARVKHGPVLGHRAFDDGGDAPPGSRHVLTGPQSQIGTAVDRVDNFINQAETAR
jgi:hypothetical protein